CLGAAPVSDASSWFDSSPSLRCCEKSSFAGSDTTCSSFKTFLIFTLSHFKLSEDVVNRILQVVLDLQHFKSSLVIFAATILQSSSAIHHVSNIDNYVHQIIKFQSILITSSHSLWSSQSFGHQKAINGFDMPLPVAVCSGLVNPLAPRKVVNYRTDLRSLYQEPFAPGLAIFHPIRNMENEYHPGFGNLATINGFELHTKAVCNGEPDSLLAVSHVTAVVTLVTTASANGKGQMINAGFLVAAKEASSCVSEFSAKPTSLMCFSIDDVA
ncbi:hypothetical protein Tco_0756282, partial [Tanacetum coccineum]